MGSVMKDKTMLSDTGVVKYIDLEGGFYGIIADDGERHYPINLGQEYQVDGLSVRYTYRFRHDVASIHMWGKPIEIADIKKLNED